MRTARFSGRLGGSICLGMGVCHTPLPRRQTDACENITLPQILFVDGNNQIELTVADPGFP